MYSSDKIAIKSIEIVVVSNFYVIFFIEYYIKSITRVSPERL